MPKSIEDIDRQIAALKEQKKRQQAQIAQKKREGLRSCKELIGEEVVNAFDNWTSIDLDLFAISSVGRPSFSVHVGNEYPPLLRSASIASSSVIFSPSIQSIRLSTSVRQAH